jgi:hypothetical protein
MDMTSIAFRGEEITGTKVENPKIVLGSSPGEDAFCTLETTDGNKT